MATATRPSRKKQKPPAQPVEAIEPRSDAEWLTRVEAAWVLGISPKRLAAWAAERRGPEYSRPKGTKLVRYRRVDLENWLNQGARQPK